MTYSELLRQLYAVRQLGVKLELERMRQACRLLGVPAQPFPVTVHIGGTNGKGSTAAFVESVARCAGKRTGVFTSPHLTSLTERFRIDGRPVSEQALAEVGDEVLRVTSSVPLTFFERVTLIGLRLFQYASVEVAVLEVGLGGRLDSTNVVVADLAAVTGVARDHEQWLGTRLAQIAGEKAGIFKPGRGAVVGVSGDPSAVSILEQHAQRTGVRRCVVVGRDRPAQPPAGWALGIPGGYQSANAACALAVMEELDDQGLLAATSDMLRRGLAEACCPGRFDTLVSGPVPVVADGAHNPHAAAAVATELAGRRYAVVLGVSRDKDVAGIAGPLARGAVAVVATQSTSERACPASELAAAIPGAVAEPRLAEALAIARAHPVELVLVAGSLFLVGDARALLCGDRVDPVVAQDPMTLSKV